MSQKINFIGTFPIKQRVTLDSERCEKCVKIARSLSRRDTSYQCQDVMSNVRELPHPNERVR